MGRYLDDEDVNRERGTLENMNHNGIAMNYRCAAAIGSGDAMWRLAVWFIHGYKAANIYFDSEVVS